MVRGDAADRTRLDDIVEVQSSQQSRRHQVTHKILGNLSINRTDDYGATRARRPMQPLFRRLRSRNY